MSSFDDWCVDAPQRGKAWYEGRQKLITTLGWQPLTLDYCQYAASVAADVLLMLTWHPHDVTPDRKAQFMDAFVASAVDAWHDDHGLIHWLNERIATR